MYAARTLYAYVQHTNTEAKKRWTPSAHRTVYGIRVKSQKRRTLTIITCKGDFGAEVKDEPSVFDGF